MIGVCETSILNTLHHHLGMTKVSARWVPRMLTPLQKRERVECSRQFLELCGERKEEVMARIVTGDETWVHHYEPESKQESMQWHKNGTPPPKKFKVTQSAGKIMATVFWDTEGILLIDYKERGVPITGQYDASLLERFKEAIKEKRRGKLSKGVLLLHDNAPVYTCHVAMAAIHQSGFEELNHPPYSPDLTPCDYYLFPKMKKELRGKKIDNDEEVKSAISPYFDTKDKSFFFDGINKLFERSEKCIRVKGEYVEKDFSFSLPSPLEFGVSFQPPSLLFRELFDLPSYIENHMKMLSSGYKTVKKNLIRNWILREDSNAHHTPWGSTDTNNRAAGKAAQQIVTGQGTQGKVQTDRPTAKRQTDRQTDKGQTDRQEASKRPRLDDTVSPRGQYKKPRSEGPLRTMDKKSFADAATADLLVVITGKKAGHISAAHAGFVLKALEDAVVEELLMAGPSTDEGPNLKGKHIIGDGALSFWCETPRTLEWVKKTVAGLKVPGYDDELMVQRQIDRPKKVVCGLLGPGTREPHTIAKLLRYQNKQADVDRWLPHKAIAGDDNMFLVFSTTRDVAEKLLERGRRLCYLMGSVYVRFRNQGGQYLESLPPLEPPTCAPSPSTSGGIAASTPDQKQVTVSPADPTLGEQGAADVIDEWADKLGGIDIGQESHRNGSTQEVAGGQQRRGYCSGPGAVDQIQHHMWPQQHRCDITTIQIIQQQNPSVPVLVVASAYMPEGEETPSGELAELVRHCEQTDKALIIGTDSNAHHQLWGMTKSNKRGEELVDYLFTTNLNIINTGSEPT
ncbi:hypothetical protein evm_004619 [Chilo suppressalis]|nr:hypothetical protein evm_004619 [Chilo suppressalis]